jgi:hypothetical protein
VAAKLKGDPAFVTACKGQAGPPGPSGADAALDMPALVAAVRQALPPIQVEFLGAGQQPASRQEVALGQTLRVPPVIVAKKEGGKLYWQVKPLGQPINLELVPVN